MAASISFASVCIRKLDRLKLLLTTQRIAFESDVLADESHVEFLDTTHSRLLTANTLRGVSLRTSTQRLSNFGQRQTISKPNIPNHSGSFQEGSISKRKKAGPTLSIGGVSPNVNEWVKQKSVRVEKTERTSRPNLSTQLYESIKTKHEYPASSRDDLKTTSSHLNGVGMTSGPLTSVHRTSRVLSGKSQRPSVASESRQNFFSSLKKLGSQNLAKQISQEGSKTDRYPKTFHLDIINESPIQQCFTMSNPSIHSIHDTEPLAEGKIPKSPPSQVTHFQPRDCKPEASFSKLSKLLSPNVVERTSLKQSPRKLLSSLAAITNKP